MKKLLFMLIPILSMGQTKISDMPTASDLVGTVYYPIIQGGVNKKATPYIFQAPLSISGFNVSFPSWPAANAVGLLSNNGSGVLSWSTGNPFADNTAILKNNTDPTKLLKFDLSGFTTATTNTLTPPNYSGTIATLAGVETFTNKTISGASNTLSNIGNSSLTNSTISGISLGSNLANLSIGAELISGGASSYNGSVAKSIAIQPASVTNAMLGTINASVFTALPLMSNNTQIGTSYTLVLSDAGNTVVVNTASSNTLTIPPNSSVAFPIGTQINVEQKGIGVTTVTAGAGVTVNFPSGGNASTAGQGGTLTIWQSAANVWEVWNGVPLGNLSISNFNSGTGASSTTFWRGDGTWAAPFSLTNTGASGASTFTSGTLNIPTYTIAGLGGWSLANGGTLTGVNTITSNAPNQLNFNATFTANANNQYFLTGTRTLTSRAIASDNIWDTQHNSVFNIASTGINAVSKDISATYVQTGGLFGLQLKVGSPSCSGMTPGTYTSVSPASSTFGSGALLTVTVTNATTIGTITITTPGTNYQVSGTGTLTLNGSQFGGAGSNVFEITQVTNSNLGIGSAVLNLGVTGEHYSRNPKIINFLYNGTISGSIGYTVFGTAKNVGYYDDANNLSFFLSSNYGIVVNRPLVNQSTTTLNGALAAANASFSGKLTANSSGLALKYSSISANYTVGINDFFIECTANTFTVTLPTAGVNIVNQVYVISNTGAGTITIATTASETIDGAAPGTLASGTKIRLMSKGTGWVTW